jgi:selenocysteine lyase/cysteine desulfurase
MIQTPTRYQKEFPHSKDIIYLNHAAVAPQSRSVERELNMFLKDAQMGYPHEEQWLQKVETIREKAAFWVGSRPEEIAFVNNVTMGASVIANAIDWHTGDTIVTPRNQFPANLYPWLNCRERGVQVKMPTLPHNDSAYDILFESVDKQTRMLAISFVEYDDGFRYDLERIGTFCKEHGILFFVDAVQGLGVFTIDSRHCHIDVLSTSGHKWLLGPSGQGFMHIRQDLLKTLHIPTIGWLSVIDPFMFDKLDQSYKPSASRIEGGTFNLMGLVCLGAALDLLTDTGPDHIRKRVLKLTDELIELLDRKEIPVHSNRAPQTRSGIVTFEPPGGSASETVARLRQSNIIVSERMGRIRVSPHYYNSSEELLRLIDAL